MYKKNDLEAELRWVPGACCLVPREGPCCRPLGGRREKTRELAVRACSLGRDPETSPETRVYFVDHTRHPLSLFCINCARICTIRFVCPGAWSPINIRLPPKLHLARFCICLRQAKRAVPSKSRISAPRQDARRALPNRRCGSNASSAPAAISKCTGRQVERRRYLAPRKRRVWQRLHCKRYGRRR